VVARLEETSFRIRCSIPTTRSSQRAADLLFDARADRAADDVDERPVAESPLCVPRMRERYGMVRGREALLPIELVVQETSPASSSARSRACARRKTTPDAVLYR